MHRVYEAEETCVADKDVRGDQDRFNDYIYDYNMDNDESLTLLQLLLEARWWIIIDSLYSQGVDFDTFVDKVASNLMVRPETAKQYLSHPISVSSVDMGICSGRRTMVNNRIYCFSCPIFLHTKDHACRATPYKDYYLACLSGNREKAAEYAGKMKNIILETYRSYVNAKFNIDLL